MHTIERCGSEMAGPMLLCYLYAMRLAQSKSLIANRQLKIKLMTLTKTIFFCTYKSAETKGAWRKSREYPTIDALTSAMLPYLREHPNTQVTYQTRNQFTSQP